jgi:hypothetical protein
MILLTVKSQLTPWKSKLSWKVLPWYFFLFCNDAATQRYQGSDGFFGGRLWE